MPEAAFVPNTIISSAAVNDDLSDIATALTGSVASNGVTPITAPLKNPSGSIIAPGVAFNNDLTTGIYLPTTSKLGIVANGVGVLVNSLAYSCSNAVVVAGGGTYVVGDEITVAGGTYITPTVLRVATLSGSAVATVTVLTPGRYTIQPTNPVSQSSTTGSGSGATFTLTFASALLLTDLAGVNLAQSFGASPYAANTLLQLASANDLATAAGITYPISVAHGGTGNSTLVPYAPIIGGTTSTAATQQAAVGASGQVLVSGGASAVPAYAGNWSSTTPTPTPATGSFTSASALVEYQKIGSLVTYKVTVTITTNGTAGGNYIRCPLPFPITGSNTCWMIGRETLGGLPIMGQVQPGTSYVEISLNSAPFYPGGSGSFLILGGFSQVAP